MTRHAKASSAGSTQRQASRLGRFFRGAFAVRGASGDAKGSGASSAASGSGPVASSSTRVVAVALFLPMALLALSAAPALATSFGELGSGAGQFNSPRGVAVNQSNGDVYVAEANNNRISEFSPSGAFMRAWGINVVANGQDQANTLQVVRVNATGGDFTLTFGASTTAEIPATATAAQVQTALNALSSISTGGGSVAVSGGPGNVDGTTPYFVTFGGGPLAGTAQPTMTAASGTLFPLSGGTATVTVATRNEGATGFEVCNANPPSNDTCQAGVASVGNGAIRTPKGGIAVEQSTGDVYVLSIPNRRVEKFDPNGNFILMFGGGVDKTTGSNVCTAASGDACEVGTSGSGNGQFSWATGLAGALITTDASGHVWVGDTNRVQEFSSSGVYETKIELPGAGASTALAVDPSGNLYAINASVPGIRKFNASSILNTLDVGGAPKALTVDSAGNLFVRDESGGNHFLKFSPSGAQLDVFGFSAVAGTLGGIALGETAQSLYAVDSASVVILPAPLPGPLIESGAEANQGAASGTVNATINPEGNETTYHVEYVDAEDFEHNGEGFSSPATESTPQSASIGSGFSDKFVSVSISGLQHEVTYHARIVATNSAGTVTGSDLTFSTNNPTLAPPSANCPNPAHTGLSASLPDCRAYELITPVNKGDAEDMYSDIPSVYGGAFDQGFPSEEGISSEESNKFFLNTTARFGAFPASGENGYVFTRGAGGWQMTPLASQTDGVQSIETQILNPDLSLAAIHDSVGSAGNLATARNLGLIGSVGGPYATLFEVPYTAAGANVRGASPNFGKVIVESTEHNLLPGGPAEAQIGESNALFEYANGHYSPLDVKTDGSLLSTCGATSPAAYNEIGPYSHAVSADGSRVFFESPDPQFHSAEPSCFTETSSASQPFNWSGTPPQLYLRSGTTTTEVSAPEAGVIDPKGPQPVAYAGASADGSRVFFVTRGELTSNDTGLHSPELYEYDVETETLARVSRGESGSAEGNVYWDVVSEDGSTVYFTATGRLAAGAPAASGEELNLYRYDTTTGSTAYIATVSNHDKTETSSGIIKSALNDSNPIALSNNWQTTPDGHYLLFAAVESLTGFNSHDPTGQCRGDLHFAAGNHNCGELYRYDAATAKLICVSCAPDGAAPSSDSLFDRSTHTRQVRAISNGGSYVFFDTANSLAPQDTNGKLDVYEWHEGKISLISSGQDSSNSYFLGSSPDGRDVFLGTHARLAPQDTDSSGDLYDARVEGGFPPFQGSAACEGDACAKIPAQPNDAAPGSESFHGAGNVHEEPLARCRRAFARKHGKCVKKKARKHRHSHRTAGHNRGGSK